MTKVEQAEHTLYMEVSDMYSGVFFVGVGKELPDKIVLIVYIDMDDETVPYITDSWEGFRVIVKELESLIS